MTTTGALVVVLVVVLLRCILSLAFGINHLLEGA